MVAFQIGVFWRQNHITVKGCDTLSILFTVHSLTLNSIFYASLCV